MKLFQRFFRAAAWIAIPLAIAAVPARAQNFTWNGSGTGLWTTAANWLPNSGTPTSSSLVQFTPAAGAVNPSVTGSTAISRLRIANTPTWGNWTFSGGGSLVAHGGTNAFVVSGLGTTTLDGVSLAGSGTAADIRLGYGNGLTLVNSASATTLIGGTTNGINLAGGRLTIDRSAGGTAAVTVSGSTVPVNLGGGMLMVKAAASGNSTFSIGGNLQPNGQAGTIWLANNASGRTSVSFDTLSRAGTRFVVESGTLGGAAATDPRVTFTNTPNLYNGIFSQNNNAVGSNGYAIISNPAGTQAAFANYTSGTGVVAATTTSVSGNLSSNQSSNARLTASGTIASNATVSYNSLTIQPSAAGQSLTIGTNGVLGGSLSNLPVLLTGSHDFSITGGAFGGNGGTAYMWVSNPERTLTIGSTLTTGFFVKLGPGTIALTGTLTSMQTKGLGASEGVLRVTAANLLSSGTNDPGVLFQGTGVLEYDLTTGSGDVSFTKGLSNNAAGSAFANIVSWTLTNTSGTALAAPRGGSGGFSAMSTNANSRNLVIAIGGTAAPTALTWGGTSGFVIDGSALKFGSPTSTNTVVWKNAIALDSGSPTTYEARVFEVTAGNAGGAADHTRIDGAITGSAATELVKSGSGRLVLAGTNTFAGAARIAAGILEITSGSAIASTSGVSIADAARLRYSGGTGTVNRAIAVMSGTGTVENTGGGTLTLSGGLSKNGTVLRLSGGTFDVTGLITGTSANSDLVVAGTSTVTLSNANTYNGPTFVNESSTLILGTNSAIPSNSVVTLGNAATTGTLNMNGFTNEIGGLAFGSANGTLRLAATSTSAAPLTASAGTMTLTNGTLDLAGSGTSAGLYRVLSAQTVSGTFASVTNASAAYQVLTTASSVDYQQRAVLGAVTVTSPTVSIITGGSAAFTYTVANNALSGGADLGFSSGSLSATLAGTSSGTAAAGGASGAISGLVFTGTSIGSGQQGTFTVTAPTAYGATTATGTVSVNVLNHSLASFTSTGNDALSLDFGTYDNGSWSGVGNGSLGFSLWNIASDGFLAADTAGLALYDVIFTSGTNIFGTGLSNFGDLTAGTSNSYTASVLSPGALDQGTFQGVYTLKFRDQQNLSGAANTRDLTLTMNVIVVPEPGTIALAGIGIAAAAWGLRRRRGC